MDLKAPSNLDMKNIVSSWRKFKTHYEIYSTAKELNLKPEKVQAATLLNVLGEEAVDLILSLISDENDLKNPKKIVSVLDDYVKSKYSIVYRRYLFNIRNQQTDESFDAFYEAITELAKDCGFKNDKESLIRDKIISGVQNDSLRERLLYEELPLAEVVRISSDHETEKLGSKRKIDEKVEVVTQETPESYEVKRRKEKYKHKQIDISDADLASIKPKTLTTETPQQFSVLQNEMAYDPATFWQNLPTLEVKKAAPKEVVAMTKHLFISLLTKQTPGEILSRAGDVASQLRSPDDIEKLVIDPDVIKRDTKFCDGVIGSMKKTEIGLQITCPTAAKFYEECFNETTEKHAYIWGPFFAFFLLRYTEKSLVFMSDFRDKLFCLYHGPNYEINFCPEFDNFILLSSCIERLYSTPTNPVQYNTIMYGLISAYCKENVTPKGLELLDFLSVPAFKNKGIGLLVLVDKLTKYFKCSPRELAAEYCYPECTPSWRRFFLFKEKCLKQLSQDKLWCFARSFKKESFSQLSYINNFFLCNLLALHHDFIYRNSGRRSLYWHSLRFVSKLAFPVSKSDVSQAISEHNQLKNKMKMGSQEARVRLVEAEKLVNRARSSTYQNLCRTSCEIPPLLPTDVNFVILTHLEMEKKFRSGSLTPLSYELIPEVEQDYYLKIGEYHQELTVDDALNSLRRL